MQVILQVITGSRTGERIEVVKYPSTLGRNDTCDIIFAHRDDAGVSNFHAVIALEGDAPVIRDMNSTNGTYIDGNRVQRFILTDGIVVRLAKEGPEFRILLDEEAKESSSKAIQRESGKYPAQDAD